LAKSVASEPTRAGDEALCSQSPRSGNHQGNVSNQFNNVIVFQLNLCLMHLTFVFQVDFGSAEDLTDAAPATNNADAAERSRMNKNSKRS
jgi:hypothetical protein